jgi:hypothetical protein
MLGMFYILGLLTAVVFVTNISPDVIAKDYAARSQVNISE